MVDLPKENCLNYSKAAVDIIGQLPVSQALTEHGPHADNDMSFYQLSLVC